MGWSVRSPCAALVRRHRPTHVGNAAVFRIGFPAVLWGTWLGLRLYGKLDEATFRTIVLVLVLISGLTLLPWPGLGGV